MPFGGFYQIKRTIKTQGEFPPFFLLVITTTLLTFNLFNFINLKAVNILFWDQWDLFQAFFVQHNLIEIFRWQHGPHRQGFAFIVNDFLQQLTNWNTHTESLFIGVLIFMACLLAIYLKYKLFKKIQYGDIIIPLIFLNLNQFEIFIGTPNPSHGSFSLLILMLYLISWLVKNSFKKYLLINIFNFLLIYSGFGLFIGFITPFIFLIDYFKKQQSLKFFIFNLTFSVISLSSFFFGYLSKPAAEYFKFPDPYFYLYPFFISRMFANFFNLQSLGTIMYLFGLILFLFIIYALIKTLLSINSNQYIIKLVSIILLSFSLLFVINATMGRLYLGMEGADASRYCTYLIPAFLGIYFYLLNQKQKHFTVMFSIIFAVTLLYGNFTVTSRPEINWYFEGKTNWKNCYLINENIDLCNKETNFKIYPYPEETDLKNKLDYLKLKKLNLYN